MDSAAPTVTGVISFEEIDGVTLYHIQLSNGQVLKRRYNQIKEMYDKLPSDGKKKLNLQVHFPGKTGVRKANTKEKNERRVAFDSLFKLIVVDKGLVDSKAFQDLLKGKPAKTSEQKAEKGAKKGAKKLRKVFKKISREPFKHLDVSDFDSFFQKCQAPLDTLGDLSGNMGDAHDALQDSFDEQFVKDAGVQEGDLKALIVYNLHEIKKASGHVKIDLDDRFRPELRVTGKHARHVEIFVSALEKLVTAIQDFVSGAPDLVEQLSTFAEECSSFPEKLQGMDGISPLKMPMIGKKLADNIKFLGGVPGEFKECYDNVKDLLKLLKDCVEETFNVDL